MSPNNFLMKQQYKNIKALQLTTSECLSDAVKVIYKLLIFIAANTSNKNN